jgi:hypothetical protein
MPSIFQGIQGFAGASGVGVMCLAAFFWGSSVFATNLPLVADLVAASATWSGVVTIPLLVVAYVVGLLAIAVVDRVTNTGDVDLGALQGLSAQRFSLLTQEAEILSGSVISFVLLGAAGFLNILAYPGWTRTLLGCGTICLGVARFAFVVSRAKHQSAQALARATGGRTSPDNGPPAV